jgi:hypothetical protein
MAPRTRGNGRASRQWPRGLTETAERSRAKHNDTEVVRAHQLRPLDTYAVHLRLNVEDADAMA